MRLQQKVSLITGAGAGIGRATAQLFAREGAYVVAVDKNPEAIEETKLQIEQAGGTCLAKVADVSQEKQVEEAIATAIEVFGSLDILCNNAGISRLKPITETTEAEWDLILGINLKGVFFNCKHAIPYMVQQRGGVIVNVASELAIMAQPLYGAYCASKGGILALTRALSLEWVDKGIRINAICPGPVETSLLEAEFEIASDPEAERKALVQSIPAGRLGTPKDIAQGILFLASEESQFMHGAALTMDGGRTIF
ncbi:MAG: glucose 1-dehydrogenase [Leptolyngbya sp. SIO3F4]|nr:glucose 1-dehydrogenase [Leptolyngbya sp. SIO3F4]